MKKIDWKEMRERVRHENAEIRKRREERMQALIDERQEEHGGAVFGRAMRRMGVPGQPRARIYAEKMAIPKERR